MGIRNILAQTGEGITSNKEEEVVVHNGNGWHGLPYYLTSCGLEDGSYNVTYNKNLVTCKECIKAVSG